MLFHFEVENHENELAVKKPDGSQLVLKVRSIDIGGLRRLQKLQQEGVDSIEAIHTQLSIFCPSAKVSDFDWIPIDDLKRLLEKLARIAMGQERAEPEKKTLSTRNLRSSRSRRRASA